MSGGDYRRGGRLGVARQRDRSASAVTMSIILIARRLSYGIYEIGEVSHDIGCNVGNRMFFFCTELASPAELQRRII